MTGISVAICSIPRKKFKHQYPKNKTLFLIFIAFLACSSNLKQFETKDQHPSLIISKLLTSKELVAETSKSCCFGTAFGKQRVNGFQTLLKSARHHYYRIFP